MISVLIPVYNQDVTILAHAIHQQLEAADIEYEILIIDDVSEPKYNQINKKLNLITQITYIRNHENMGRVKLRNYLAAKAEFPYLLFIDCDANITDNQFITNYVCEIKKYSLLGNFAILGGIAYREEPPNEMHFLRWNYGKMREEIPAKLRNQNPYKSFTPFNVILTKTVFNVVQFDESLKEYGNEDTLFGIDLMQNKIPIFHIDNPLYHDGIDPNNVFINKIETSINNLIILYKKGKIDHTFIKKHKLLNTFFRIKKVGLLFLVDFAFTMSKRFLLQKINHSLHLFWLDIYKLGYLTHRYRKEAQ